MDGALYAVRFANPDRVEPPLASARTWHDVGRAAGHAPLGRGEGHVHGYGFAFVSFVQHGVVVGVMKNNLHDSVDDRVGQPHRVAQRVRDGESVVAQPRNVAQDANAQGCELFGDGFRPAPFYFRDSRQTQKNFGRYHARTVQSVCPDYVTLTSRQALFTTIAVTVVGNGH